ncbi:hypothetical protein A5692_16725 [Mycobacterium sp. E342]|nr:hypothetical protein A9X04_18520 [Mycobacterium sp. E3247]OBH31624.1 hypothetical protein A5692_16725 [Mycobacterium sp. E342]
MDTPQLPVRPIWQKSLNIHYLGAGSSLIARLMWSEPPRIANGISEFRIRFDRQPLAPHVQYINL